MTRPALRTDRRAARWPRLLLLAALLLGIVTMHTLGHPSRSHTMEDVAPAVAVASAGRAADHTPVHAPGHASADRTDTVAGAVAGAGAGAGMVTGPRAGTVTVPAHASHDRGPAAESPPPGSGMDPMSVCLAVLGGLTLLILGAGPAGLRDAAPLGGAARGPGRSGGPDPPSPRELLTRLAVLRV
ncbi:hypothetical protein [Streptomyces sp. NBC_01443]|uniref:hypothetical protein n=1 Tax=Streptomyces sp. NBC_01443 TaxID=2903868 RepID=UPI00224D0AE1|nr:hypothetical protein [Streptomyces sp. NBC_01443]MCX4630177.1 hypothetical protein [Streptomyces sp. NBC_01443]